MICYVCGKPFKSVLQHGIGMIYLCGDHAMNLETYIEKMKVEHNIEKMNKKRNQD